MIPLTLKRDIKKANWPLHSKFRNSNFHAQQNSKMEVYAHGNAAVGGIISKCTLGGWGGPGSAWLFVYRRVFPFTG